MRTFDYEDLGNKAWTMDILGMVGDIYRSTGKQEMFLRRRPQEMERLVAIAKVQSTEASNAIEGIVTTDTRIRQLVEEKTTPQNRSEREIAGYRDALNLIHEEFASISITRNYILQLHRIMLAHTGSPMAGRTKNVPNYIATRYPDGHTETVFTPLGPFETPEALDRICASYNRVISEGIIEPLVVIPTFIHDFLCIHPFNDGNGRLSRLLTTLLLYQSRFYVGRYISLEAKINRDKDAYYEALEQSGAGWHENADDPIPFITYMLGTIQSACRDFEARFELLQNKRTALDIVREASRFRIGQFSKQDICELCPSLSTSSIEGALRKLVANGEIRREGAGRATRYFRTT